jgi:predicted secreted protein
MPDDAELPSAIDLKPGEDRVITLPQHGTGGYVWSAEVTEGGVVVEELPPRGADPAILGGPVDAAFRITAKGPGTSLIRFSYGRVWEKEPVRTQELRVRVGD